MKVQFFANLGAPAVMKRTPSGSVVTSGSVVESISTKKGDEYIKVPSWYNVVVWGKNGERFAKLPKGTPLFITGELTVEEYEATDGSKRRNAKVRVETFVPFSGFLKTSDLQAPVANVPVANAPVANVPVANAPIASTPVSVVPVAESEFDFGN